MLMTVPDMYCSVNCSCDSRSHLVLLQVSEERRRLCDLRSGCRRSDFGCLAGWEPGRFWRCGRFGRASSS